MNPFLDSAKRVAKANLGIPADVNPYSLGPDKQQEYMRELSRIILEHPDNFSPQEIENARLYVNYSVPVADTYSIGDMFSDFTGEVLTQADRLNPFSESNAPEAFEFLNKILAVLFLGAVIYLIVRFIPKAGKV